MRSYCSIAVSRLSLFKVKMGRLGTFWKYMISPKRNCVLAIFKFTSLWKKIHFRTHNNTSWRIFSSYSMMASTIKCPIRELNTAFWNYLNFSCIPMTSIKISCYKLWRFKLYFCYFLILQCVHRTWLFSTVKIMFTNKSIALHCSSFMSTSVFQKVHSKKLINSDLKCQQKKAKLHNKWSKWRQTFRINHFLGRFMFQERYRHGAK